MNKTISQVSHSFEPSKHFTKAAAEKHTRKNISPLVDYHMKTKAHNFLIEAKWEYHKENVTRLILTHENKNIYTRCPIQYVCSHMEDLKIVGQAHLEHKYLLSYF